MNSKEVKWATCGFLFGFLLCYALFDMLKPQASRSTQVANATQTQASSMRTIAPIIVTPALALTVTNFSTPRLNIELPLRWVDSPSGLKDTIWAPGYSVDLIDNSHNEELRSQYERQNQNE
jgi:hypothetical protein